MSQVYTLTDAALAEGVKSVGFTASSSAKIDAKSESMFRLLHQVYDKNLDKMEIYCMRNVFAFDKSVAKRILGLNKKVQGDCAFMEEEKEVEQHKDKEESTIDHFKTDVHQSIAQEDLTKLDKELKELRAQFVRQRRRRDVVQHHLDIVRRVAKQSKTCVNDLKVALSTPINETKSGSEENMNLPDKDKLHETVSAVMMGKDVLLQVREDGLQLLRKMNVLNGNNDDKVDNSFDSVPNERLSFFSSNPNASLEDGFAAFRNQFKTSDISDVSSLVKKLSS